MALILVGNASVALISPASGPSGHGSRCAFGCLAVTFRLLRSECCRWPAIQPTAVTDLAPSTASTGRLSVLAFLLGVRVIRHCHSVS